MRSSSSGHLGLSISWLFWIMLQWTWEYKYLFQIPTLLFLDFVPKSRHAGKVVLLLISCGNSILFSTVAEPTNTPTNSAQGSPLSTSSPTLVICSLFENSHPYRCEVMSPCGFDLHFPVVYFLLYLGSNGFIPELMWLKIFHILLSLISWAASVPVTVSTCGCFNWFSKCIWASCKWLFYHEWGKQNQNTWDTILIN